MMIMAVIVTAGFPLGVMVMFVPMVMPAGFSVLVLMTMIMSTASPMFMIVGVIMAVIVPAATGLLLLHGREVEDPQDEKPNA